MSSSIFRRGTTRLIRTYSWINVAGHNPGYAKRSGLVARKIERVSPPKDPYLTFPS